MACLDLLSFLRMDLMQTVGECCTALLPCALPNRIENCPYHHFGASDRLISFPHSSKELSRSSLSILLHTQSIVLLSTSASTVRVHHSTRVCLGRFRARLHRVKSQARPRVKVPRLGPSLAPRLGPRLGHNLRPRLGPNLGPRLAPFPVHLPV
jgi:hypothetical protein